MPSQPSEPQRAPRRWSTRELIGPTLIFVGGFLIAVALALPTLLVPRLEVLELSTDRTTVATSVPTAGQDDEAATATVFDRCSLNTAAARTLPATLVRQQRIVAVQPSDARIVTLQAGTSVQIDRIWLDGTATDGDAARDGSQDSAGSPDSAGHVADCTSVTASAVKDRITLSRSSALPDLGANSAGMRGNSEIQYDSNTAPVQALDRQGYTYEFPFPMSGGDHTFFDPTTRRSVPLTYQGETSVSGRTALRYTAEVPDTDLAATGSGAASGQPATQITRPASWFGVGGDPARELTANLHQTSSWEFAIDEATGTLLDQRITIDQSYRITGDQAFADFRLTNLAATLAWDEPTRAAMAQEASTRATPVLIWGRVVPIAAGVIGVIAVVGAIALITRSGTIRRRSAPR